MLERIESPSNVLAIRVVGKIEKSDYTTVLEPAVEQMVKEYGELRAAIVVGAEFDGLTASAFWEDIKFGVEHLSKWKRCAVVSDHDWIRHGVSIFGWMMPGEVKVFAENELAEAIAWAAA
jgi:hypothetical protein